MNSICVLKLDILINTERKRDKIYTVVMDRVEILSLFMGFIKSRVTIDGY